MKRTVIAATVALLLASAVQAQVDPTARPTAGGNTAFMSVWVGGRGIEDFNDLDDGFGNELDLGNQFAFGLEYHTISENGLGWETGAAFSAGVDEAASTGIDYDLILFELMLGARYTYPDAGRFLPYVGGGVDLVFAQLEADGGGGVTASTDDTDIGLYARAGLSYLLGDRFTLGLEARGLFATSEDLDYGQLAIVLGWGI